ncbi:M3 family metallopeptidase [Prochlorococcus sp. MIT 1341]|uniref:M3 family metallopeptidase n=1 Tax=Prochlorococcus sp. MIT 1341 TaxID=3096221 RepID=UPI002A74893C|nr:M3 family metallopeptidase [Prochlorococcus sp. MIT 1341]
MSKKDSPEKLQKVLVGHGIPNYQYITPETIEKELPILLKEFHKDLTKIENNFRKLLEINNKLTWEEIMNPIYQLSERIKWTWGVISHLNGVSNTKELRKVFSEQQPEVVRLLNRLGQSKVIYNALTKLNNKNNKFLDKVQRRILESELLSMKHRGVGLEGKTQSEFNSATERLAELSTNFSNNLLDATQQWSLVLTKKSDVDGLPKRILEALAKEAKDAGDLYEQKQSPTYETGPWRLKLDIPSYIPFITHAKKRSLREIVYKAYVQRASQGKKNNNPLIEEILTLRKQQAKLLGYKSWAELSLSNKMAKNVDAVEKLLDELRLAALPAAKKELDNLSSYAQKSSDTNISEIAPWDVSFWSEQLRQKKFNLNHEKLRPWFPLPKVLDGLFNLCNRLFDISIVPDNSNVPKWHSDVCFYKVLDLEGKDLAAFYLDPYSRPASKRGGAWMDECLSRGMSNQGKPTLPIAYLICNQTPPVGSSPSLMSFEEVETLFHEFGHGLQHMLTTINYPQAAGINNVEWDAVELPSQFMENWCLDRQTLLGMARHWQTDEPLPEEEFRKLRQSRNFNSGLSTLRQIHFALTDLRLHNIWGPELGVKPDQLRRVIAKNTTVIPPIKEDQFLCSFGHIFAGGYAAGYYSYKWAEVLSADAFAAFEESDLNNEEEIKLKGTLFKETILSLGGSMSPSDIFRKFRGRPPSTEALIRHSGLKKHG